MSHTSSGTPALDRSISLIGFAPQGATTIIKGFNPVNPHNGSTIVATIFWLGSENIIDSVTDYLTTAIPRPPVPGNPFTLVEYVTADGISMATYVATNVQNFPDGYSAPAQDSIYAVQANFRTSVTNVGMLLSAWTGVEPVFGSAIGVHRSASGSASAQTTIGPGPLTVGANSLVYAAAMSNVVAGSDPPGPPFAIVRDPNTGPLSVADASLKAEAVAGVVASGGSVNPRWVWAFSGSGDWVATGLELKPAGGAPPATGAMRVTTSTTGSSLDPDGYTVIVDGSQSQPVAANDAAGITFAGLSAGSRSVELTGVASNCAVSGANPQTVTVPTGGTATVSFTVSCAAPAAIALVELNGTLGQSGTHLGKEFNPQNPPLGSTIVVTFVWLGSANIITSVHDFLWTGQVVGNTYNLVEYVTRDGISMATYVATNVQNFPSPKTELGEELVIRAELSQPVTAGGTMISAYTGVAPVFDQALGEHRSAAGYSSPGAARTGPISVNAGALVYGVSMAADGLVGMERPPGFTWITGMADDGAGDFQVDGEYVVHGGGPVDPEWIWSFFSAPDTWLASVLALNPQAATTAAPSLRTNPGAP